MYIHISPSKKRYIGITSSPVNVRWKKGYGYKRNQHLWRAIEKYGWDNFQHRILYKNLTENEACDIEKMLIRLYNTTDPNRGYNISTGGKVGSSFRLSDEAREKCRKWREDHPISNEEVQVRVERLRNANVGRHQSTEHIAKVARTKWKSIIQLTLDDVPIRIWNSSKEASETLKIHKSTICQCCKGIKTSAGGYHWRYV